MKLFRDVSDIQGIPQQLISQFESDISKWITSKKGKISYIDLATEVLPNYIINCPYHSWQNKREFYEPLNLDRIIQQIPDNLNKNKIRQKLEGWLSDLFVIHHPYDTEKGLIYYN